MTNLQVLGCALLGLLTGLGARYAARLFVARYRAEEAWLQGRHTHSTHGGTAGSPAGQQNTDALPLRIAVLVGMTLLGIYVGWRAAGWGEALRVLLLSGVLLTVSLVDWAAHRIPNVLCLVLLILAVVQVVWLGQPIVVRTALGTAVAGGLFLLIALVSRGGMGAGDVKLAAVLGALLGYPSILLALALGIVSAGLVALGLMLTRHVGRKGYIAYGPYLALGALVVLLRALGG